MPKPFLSYEQQIEKLRQEKGLQIPDEEFAFTNLKRISYFALICGYKQPFKMKKSSTGQYRPGTTFEHIVDLYHFDEGLRAITLKYLLQVERHMRSLLSYYFCEVYGEAQSAYLDANNYEHVARPGDVAQLVRKLSDLATKPGQYGYINHNIQQHKNVPLWVLSCALTFGTVSKMYGLLSQSLRMKISKNFPQIREHELRALLNVLSKFRNVCAHGERLFSYRTHNTIPDLPAHAQLQIRQRHGQFTSGKRDLFAVIISMKYLLPESEFQMLKSELTFLLNDFSHRTPIKDENLRRYMGFPSNWQEI